MFRDPAGIPKVREPGRVPEEEPEDIGAWKCPKSNKANGKKQEESVHGAIRLLRTDGVGKDQIQTRAVAGSSPFLGA